MLNTNTPLPLLCLFPSESVPPPPLAHAIDAQCLHAIIPPAAVALAALAEWGIVHYSV